MRLERGHEGGREGKNAKMVVILIYQRSTALRDLLKCPHKPELSELGVHLATQTWFVDFMLGLTKQFLPTDFM